MYTLLCMDVGKQRYNKNDMGALSDLYVYNRRVHTWIYVNLMKTTHFPLIQFTCMCQQPNMNEHPDEISTAC